MNGYLRLFKNDHKKTDKHPDSTGDGEINGEKVDCAGWWKVGPSGKKYLSVSVKEPYKKPEPEPEPTQEVSDDDIPW